MRDGSHVPAGLVARFGSARKIVEVGVGGDFEVALEWKRALPASEVVVTDVRKNLVTREPPGLVARLDDVTRPDLEVYRGAALVYGVRLPEELQTPAALVAAQVGAVLALSPLGNELVDLAAYFQKVERFTASGGRAWWLYSKP